ncbi:MAG: hypothetical protein OEZ30_07730 [Candidatus Aminicenantes bacterium]|nr:hypothetical protein [Candidatus Aminicenantes bacterium]
MKKSELLEKLKEFRYKIGEYRELCRYYLNERIPDNRFSYIEKLQKLQEELNEKFPILESFINKYSSGRINRDQSTGIEWDIYKKGIRGNVERIKVESLNAVIRDLGGIIAKIEKIIRERPLKWSVFWRLSIVIIIFLIIEVSIIILAIRYGEGQNLFQKLEKSWHLWGGAGLIFIIFRYLGSLIIGKERIKFLGWPFTRFFKI